jgi:catechol 2,3-dioxygenase-like lactoylglutathione lyase family enzyme
MVVQVSPVKRTTVFCRSIVRSLDLYRDILGFVVVEDKVVSGPSIAKMVGLDDCQMHICHLRSGNSEDGLIGLYEISNTDILSTTLPEPGKIHLGQVAIVVNTNQPEEIYERLRKKNYSFLTLPTKYVKDEDSDYMKAGTYTEMIFYDPDGILVSILGFEAKVR